MTLDPNIVTLDKKGEKELLNQLRETGRVVKRTTLHLPELFRTVYEMNRNAQGRELEHLALDGRTSARLFVQFKEAMFAYYSQHFVPLVLSAKDRPVQTLLPDWFLWSAFSLPVFSGGVRLDMFAFDVPRHEFNNSLWLINPSSLVFDGGRFDGRICVLYPNENLIIEGVERIEYREKIEALK